MTTHTLSLPVRQLVRRDRRRSDRRERQNQGDGTPLSRLLGVAMLGWFGLMVLVTLVAVY